MKLNLLLCSLLISLCFACSKTESMTIEETSSQQIACSDLGSPRVESSKEGALFYDPTGKPNTFSTEDLQADVRRYWQDQEVQVFSLPYSHATKLLKITPDKAITLALNDIENAAAVTAEWLPANSTKMSISDGCMSYFNLDEGLVKSFGQAIEELNIPVDEQVIHGYIGLSVKRNTGLYFMFGRAELHVVEMVDNGRADSAACGVRIPPRP